jgi:photosystem II stability/assembly factor-like uncharacterized protein
MQRSTAAVATSRGSRNDVVVGRFSRLRVAAALGFLAAAVATGLTLGVSRGGGADLVTVDAGTMRFVSTVPPRSRATGAGPASLAFVSPRVGFAATTGGFRFVGRIGWVAASDRGRIERTDDGGVSWRTLWSAPGVVFDSITVSGRTIAAAGYRVPRKEMPRTRGDFEPESASWLVVASADGGRTWRRLSAPRGGGTLQVLTPRVWIVSRQLDVNTYPVRPAAVFRSSDAGRHWGRLALPRGTVRVGFVKSAVGFAGARGPECRRVFQLWRTDDGGGTWRPVSGTCGPPLTDLNAVSEHLLFAAHSTDEYPGPARSVVRRSADGGRSWRVLWRERGRQVVRLAFADAQRGFVVDELYRPGAGGGIYCPRLRVTADGGRTWSSRTIAYYNRGCDSAGSGGGPQVPTAFLGTRYAWAGDDGAGAVWRTEDSARTWRVSAEPRSLGLMELTGQALAGAAGGLTVQTAAGPASSSDGGRTWKPSGWPSDRAIALAQRRGAYLAPGSTAEGGIPMVTPDGGKTWRRLWLPRGLKAPVVDVAFTSARDGLLATGEYPSPKLAVFATHDGGQSWKRIRLPAGGPEATSASLGPGVAVITRREARPLITTNEGRTWRAFGVVADECGTVARPSSVDIWVRCATWGKPNVALMTSRDGGGTWTRRTARVSIPGLVVISGSEAWAVSEPYQEAAFRAGIPRKLWHTIDGGATWRQIWVSPSPNARVVQVTTG